MHDVSHTFAGDWYTPKPNRGMVKEDFGSGRLEVAVSLDAMVIGQVL